jgi:hypothetical protein
LVARGGIGGRVDGPQVRGEIFSVLGVSGG